MQQKLTKVVQLIMKQTSKLQLTQVCIFHPMTWLIFEWNKYSNFKKSLFCVLFLQCMWWRWYCQPDKKPNVRNYQNLLQCDNTFTYGQGWFPHSFKHADLHIFSLHHHPNLLLLLQLHPHPGPLQYPHQQQSRYIRYNCMVQCTTGCYSLNDILQE